MRIVNEEFFHIRSLSEHVKSMPEEAHNGATWEQGSLFEWRGNKLNYFSEFWNRHSHITEVYEHRGKVDFLQGLRDFLKQEKVFKLKHYETILKQADRVARNQAMFVRETIFEEVRLKQAPQLPSRRTCLWVTDRKTTEYWWESFEGKKQLFRIKLTGELHRGDNTYLAIGTFPHEIYRNNARKYWGGVEQMLDVEKVFYECLFEGFVEVREELFSLEDL